MNPVTNRINLNTKFTSPNIDCPKRSIDCIFLVLTNSILFVDGVQVNGNGVLSFIRSMQRFFNIAFPLDDPVIAPLYTHVDTRGSGTVYYCETDSPEIVSRAGGLVRSSFKDARDFMPSHVFLATWLDVGYFNEKSDKVSDPHAPRLLALRQFFFCSLGSSLASVVCQPAATFKLHRSTPTKWPFLRTARPPTSSCSIPKVGYSGYRESLIPTGFRTRGRRPDL